MRLFTTNVISCDVRWTVCAPATHVACINDTTDASTSRPAGMLCAYSHPRCEWILDGINNLGRTASFLAKARNSPHRRML